MAELLQSAQLLQNILNLSNNAPTIVSVMTGSATSVGLGAVALGAVALGAAAAAYVTWQLLDDKTKNSIKFALLTATKSISLAAQKIGEAILHPIESTKCVFSFMLGLFGLDRRYVEDIVIIQQDAQAHATVVDNFYNNVIAAGLAVAVPVIATTIIIHSDDAYHFARLGALCAMAIHHYHRNGGNLADIAPHFQLH